MMAELLRQGRYADEVMQLLAKRERLQKPVGFGQSDQFNRKNNYPR